MSRCVAARWLGRLLALPAWQLLHVTQLIIKLTGDSNSSNNNGVPHCNQCESEWVARPRSRIPVQCPRCKRVDWAEPKKRRGHGGDDRSEEVQTVPQRPQRVAGPGNGKQPKVDLQEVPAGASPVGLQDSGSVKSCPSCGSMSGHQKWCKAK